jgi:hypothetical protein
METVATFVVAGECLSLWNLMDRWVCWQCSSSVLHGGGIRRRQGGLYVRCLRELGVALVRANNLGDWEMLYVYAASGGTAARTGAFVPTVDVE